MLLLIPTYGRPDNQRTYDSLKPAVRQHVRLVVSPTEEPLHTAKGRRTISCSAQGRGTTAVRSWIMDYCVRSKIPKVCMLDDDLTLQKRQPDLRCVGESTEADQVEMFKWMEDSLDTYSHAAFTERNAAWADEESTRVATKGIQVVGYNIRNVRDAGCQFNAGNVPDWFFIEDYHMTLQLFQKGLPNIVSREYRVNFGPSNATGGCSKFRTPERMKEAAHLLQSLHPRFVQAVQKETKTSYGGGVRWNVKVQWKKAYESSKEKTRS